MYVYTFLIFSFFIFCLYTFYKKLFFRKGYTGITTAGKLYISV